MRALLLVLILLSSGGAARAGAVQVRVTDAAGRPLPDAVVTVHRPGKPPAPIRFDWPGQVVQAQLRFQPRVLIAPVGSEVVFPNRDKVRHHVYSFSPAKRFELKLYGREEARSLRFERVGVVALGCNIHDVMQGWIHVVDTPWAAVADASGVAALREVPSGGATLRVWHPQLKSADSTMSRPLVVPGSGDVVQVFAVPTRASRG